MDRNFFWELFRDTGEPVCWLLTRIDDPPRAEKEEKQPDGEEKPSLS